MDPIAELAALEASSATASTAVPPAAPVPGQFQADPPPGGVVDVTVDLNNPIPQTQQAPVPAPQPAPIPAVPAQLFENPTPPPAPAPVQAPAPTPEPPAPAPQPPAPNIPEDIERRYYMRGLTEAQQLTVAIMANNRDLTPLEAAQLAQQRLGMGTAPAAPPSLLPAEPAAPAAPVITAETVNAQLDTIESELQTLDPVLDSARWKELQLESTRLSRQLPSLLLHDQQQQQAALQQEALTADQTIAHYRAQAEALYPSLSDAASPVTQAYRAEYSRLVASDDPMSRLPNFEVLLATQVASSLGILPHSTHAPAPAAPAPAPAPSPAPGPAPVVGMPAISGQQSTSADRVMHAPAANPAADLNAQYQQAVAADDFAAMERLSGLAAAGTITPPSAQPGGYSISISGAAA